MKELKKLIIAMAMVLPLIAQAQTKEETIEFLIQNKHIGCDVFSSYHHGGYFQTNYSFSDNMMYRENIRPFSAKFKISYKDILYVEDVSKLEMRDDDKLTPIVTFVYIPVKEYYKLNGETGTYEKVTDENRFTIAIPHYNNLSRENGEKVLRAIMHLAKLSGAAPYKDLFGE